MYKIKVEGLHNTTSAPIEVTRSVPVTTFYDEGGYLHRYKVKELFDETLTKFINAPR